MRVALMVPPGYPLAEVTARIAEYAAAGAQTLVYAPACERADLARVVRTFAEDVLPGLRELPDGGDAGG